MQLSESWKDSKCIQLSSAYKMWPEAAFYFHVKFSARTDNKKTYVIKHMKKKNGKVMEE